MICYPSNATEVECKALNDYWLLMEGSRTYFLHRVTEIDRVYRPQGCRLITSLLTKSCFFINHHAFVCYSCKKNYPALKRSDYIDKVTLHSNFICPKCVLLKIEQNKERADEIIDDYKNKNLNVSFDVNSLSFEEAIFLLCVTAGRSDIDDSFLCYSAEDLTITGVESIDEKILFSLVRKKAITYIRVLPPDVDHANQVLYGGAHNVDYDDGKFYHQGYGGRYRHPDSVKEGIYINEPYLDETTGFASISTLLYQRLQACVLSIGEIATAKSIIKEIQLNKLYRLVQEISKEYIITIDNSTALSALLNHLAERYAPQSIYFTFNYKAKDVITYIHKNNISDYISKSYFTNFVGSYIKFVENKGGTLEKGWNLPPALTASSFEAIFCQIFLNGHFNWDCLSTSDIVALWLKSAHLDDGAQKLLTDNN